MEKRKTKISDMSIADLKVALEALKEFPKASASNDENLREAMEARTKKLAKELANRIMFTIDYEDGL